MIKIRRPIAPSPAVMIMMVVRQWLSDSGYAIFGYTRCICMGEHTRVNIHGRICDGIFVYMYYL